MSFFHLSNGGGIPPHSQIIEQVKVALALGKLRPGDVLPSIRAVEDQFAIGRMVVRRAYLKLQESGLVKMVHGKGAVVTDYARDRRHARKAEVMQESFLRDLREAGLEPLSFARMFYQKLVLEESTRPSLFYVDSSLTMARDLGQQIQNALGVQVKCLSLAEAENYRSKMPPGSRVLVDYYYVEDAARALRGKRCKLYPISWDYDPQFLERIRELPPHSKVGILMRDSEAQQESTQTAVQEFMSRFSDRSLKFSVRTWGSVDLHQIAREPYRIVLVGVHLWDDQQDSLLQYPEMFWRIRVRVNAESLEIAKEKMGFVL